MRNLEKEKLDIIEGLSKADTNPAYNLNKEDLDKMNKNMSNLSDAITVKINDIITKDRSDADFDELWSYFKENHLSEFTKYMGYGLPEIEKIGIKEFINFMDWRSNSDIDKYKEDRIKAIPCVHCKSKFTTFQIDLGLCSDCQPRFDLLKFDEMCGSSEDNEAGSSAGLITMFVYIDDFRNLFDKEFPFESRAILCAIEDNFLGNFSKDFIISFVDDNKKISNFINEIDSNIEKLHSISVNRYSSIKKILTEEIDVNNRTTRIEELFKNK